MKNEKKSSDLLGIVAPGSKGSPAMSRMKLSSVSQNYAGWVFFWHIKKLLSYLQKNLSQIHRLWVFFRYMKMSVDTSSDSEDDIFETDRNGLLKNLWTIKKACSGPYFASHYDSYNGFDKNLVLNWCFWFLHKAMKFSKIN